MRNFAQEGRARVLLGALAVIIAAVALFTYGSHAAASHFLGGMIVGIALTTTVSLFMGSRPGPS
jgi:F0F1-type ATP synthase assembly protein I